MALQSTDLTVVKLIQAFPKTYHKIKIIGQKSTAIHAHPIQHQSHSLNGRAFKSGLEHLRRQYGPSTFLPTILYLFT